VLRSRTFAADAEREAAAAALAAHYSEGRLLLPELEERIGRVYRARTQGEIARAFRQLPDGRRRYAVAAAVAAAGIVWLLTRRVVWPLCKLAARTTLAIAARIVPARGHLRARP
jgi:hypothetical protein